MSTLRSLQPAVAALTLLIAAPDLSAAEAPKPASATTQKPAAAAPAPVVKPTHNLYERIDGKLNKNPELANRLGTPPPELHQFDWLVGTWAVDSTVYATASAQENTLAGTSVVTRVLGDTWLQIADEYMGKEQDIGYITYNIVTKKWVASQVDASGNSVMTTSPGWNGNKIVFTGKATIVGEEAMLRQTIEKISDTRYVIENEERLPNGKWVALDRYVYRKQP